MPARSCSPVGHRTSYSRSSWERCLNGKALPPATAITEFAAAAGVRATALLIQRQGALPGFRAGLRGDQGQGDLHLGRRILPHAARADR
ncbi:hypothetical protein [Streptomyces microflavus]|uniref:hypothetical protein n=1 Tax=Streptomyces microflavus TaxID=1919 RepID=UPI0033C41C9C